MDLLRNVSRHLWKKEVEVAAMACLKDEGEMGIGEEGKAVLPSSHLADLYTMAEEAGSVDWRTEIGKWWRTKVVEAVLEGV